MREILFRGKRIDNGELVEGAFLNDRDGAFYICPAVSDISYGDSGNRRRIGCWYKVDPYTVGQYTNLKDKNGKRIFEGDIVQAHFRTNHSKQIFRVTFDDGMFIFNNGYVKLPVRGIYRIKVIGNVHDNPEFMKGDADSG